MKIVAAVCSVGLLLLAVVFGAALQQPSQVEVGRLNSANWKHLVPEGKEVDAIYGDLVLKNDFLTAVIAEPLATRHANMTVRDIGGALIDLTVNNSQSDQLSAFYPGKRTYPYRSFSVKVEGKVVDLKSTANRTGKISSITVRAAATEGRPLVETTYQLEADKPYLKVTTRFENSGSKTLKVSLVDDIRADGGKEEMTKSKNGTSNLFWIQDSFWGQAYGVWTPGRLKIQSDSNSRTSELKYVTAESKSNSVTLPPGKSYQLTRLVFPGANQLDVKAVERGLQKKSVYPVKMTFRNNSGRPISKALVELSQNGKLYGSGRTDSRGVIKTRLPAEAYEINVSAFGKSFMDTGEFRTEVTIGFHKSDEVQVMDVTLGDFLGTVVGNITDGTGKPIACKVEFIGAGETSTPDFGPVSGDYAVKNLYYAPKGKFEQKIPAGKYEVIVSHGPEYDAIFTEMVVAPGKTAKLSGQLKRSVDTAGWVSTDYHSHSSPSGDNTGSQFGRVLNLVGEHIEFAPCTEHNRVSTYAGHIKRLGIGSAITSVSGMELTGSPLPLNHQNTFPMVHKPRTQDGGGPVTDVDPEKQIERIVLWDNRSEKLIQQNHPDIGWLFYDRDGNGESDSGFFRSFPHMNVMELHPISNALGLDPFETFPGRKGNSRVFNWLQLLNQGFRIYGVVNTDAHYNYHGSGGLRNWVQSSTDNPGEIDTMEMVRHSKQGRVIISNGPYLKVQLREAGTKNSITAGQELQTHGKNPRPRHRPDVVNEAASEEHTEYRCRPGRPFCSHRIKTKMAVDEYPVEPNV